MKMFFSISMLLFLIAPILTGAGEFKRIDQWKHDEVCGREFYSLIDHDNHVVAGFGHIGNRIISPGKLIKFAPRGEGPGDLTNFKAAYFYNSDLAIMERQEKIKIFTKKNGTYVWKETKWLKRGYWADSVKDAVFFDNKLFVTGRLSANNQENLRERAHLKVYGSDGSLLKQLLKVTYSKPNQFHELSYFVIGYKTETVFVMKENELKVHVVSSKSLEVLKTVNPEVPGFYKKMPETFYAWKKYDNPKDNFGRDLENWDMGYSSIQKVVVQDGRLVVQVRTANAKMKKFALLFYNGETFKLEKTVFLDDFLLAAKDGKFYCFANGNPGRDEDTDDCIINIYSFQKKK